MSTRCCVLVRSVDPDGNSLSNDIILYHHYDGYPNKCGVGPSLKKLTQLIQENWYSCTQTRFANALLKGNVAICPAMRSYMQPTGGGNDLNSEPPKKYMYCMFDDGYDLSDNLHGDIEYLYVVNIVNKEVEYLDYDDKTHTRYEFDKFDLRCYNVWTLDTQCANKYITPFSLHILTSDEYIEYLEHAERRMEIEDWDPQHFVNLYYDEISAFEKKNTYVRDEGITVIGI